MNNFFGHKMQIMMIIIRSYIKEILFFCALCMSLSTSAQQETTKIHRSGLKLSQHLPQVHLGKCKLLTQTKMVLQVELLFFLTS